MNNSEKKSNHSLPKFIKLMAIGAGVYFVANAIYKEFSKYDLKGKVVLIAGGSRGLGLVLARQLAAKGAYLALCARSTKELELARLELESYGAEVLTLTADITDRERVHEMINEIIHYYGRLDVLINNASIIQVGPQETMGIEEYEQAMKVNFWGPLYTILATIPHFKGFGEGRIVNITSIGGKIAVPHLLPYIVSKFALVGLSEGMHAELKKHNIHVTTVVPNLMRTGSPRHITVKGNHEAEYAWFKVSGSFPLVSQKAEVAAIQIIKALQYGESEAILSFTAKLATAIQGIAPGWINLFMRLANRLLPDNAEGGFRSKKGYESESKLSRGLLASLTDEAAKRNNEWLN